MHRRCQVTLTFVGNMRANYVACIMTTLTDSIGRSADAQTPEALVEAMKPYLLAVVREQMGYEQEL